MSLAHLDLIPGTNRLQRPIGPDDGSIVAAPRGSCCRSRRSCEPVSLCCGWGSGRTPASRMRHGLTACVAGRLPDVTELPTDTFEEIPPDVAADRNEDEILSPSRPSGAA